MPPNKPVIWTDIHISPVIAKWLNEEFEVEAVSFYRLNFHTTSDYIIFMKGKQYSVIIITKDKDFLQLLETFNAPPFIIFLKTGNISNDELKKILKNSFQRCLDQILLHKYKITEIE